MSTWTMPIEGNPQQQVWMSFPKLGPTFGDTDDQAAEARAAWTAVAHAVHDFEPVKMLVNPDEIAVARRMLSSEIDIIPVPLDDSWLRDSGPTFVLGERGTLGAVTWVFNGWGQQPPDQGWQKDAKLGRFVAELAGAEIIDSAMVNEGGGIHVDGAGTVLLTDTVQLDRKRNPQLSRNDIEAELLRTLDVTNCIWLPRGLYRDSQALGTRGHVDIVATIPQPGKILLHRQQNSSHPDHFLYDQLRETLDESTTAEGDAWQIIDVPAPDTLRDDEGWVDYSYINHLVVNDGVIACSYGDQKDAMAAEILAEAYPGRRVVSVDARNIFRYGGGIHCITQQQPVSAPH